MKKRILKKELIAQQNVVINLINESKIAIDEILKLRNYKTATEKIMNAYAMEISMLNKKLKAIQSIVK